MQNPVSLLEELMGVTRVRGALLQVRQNRFHKDRLRCGGPETERQRGERTERVWGLPVHSHLEMPSLYAHLQGC
jgi:hypothetical protein